VTRSVLDQLDELHELDVVPDVVPPPPPSSRSMRAAVAAPPAPPPVPPPKLERDGSYKGTFTGSIAKAEIVAGSLAQNPAAWIEQLWRSPDDALFAERSAFVEPAVRILAERGDVRALWAIACALFRAASDGAHDRAAARAAMANKVLHAFGDPTMLGAVATAVLAEGEEPSEAGRRILLQAGVAGAYGLYGARLRAVGQPAARSAFVTLMRDFGIKAWPVVKAALEKLHKNIADPRAREVAEDLLLTAPATAPSGGDDSAGHLVMRFVRVDAPAVNKAATLAILRIWGERARPLLFGLLDGKQDSVRLAALAGLRQLDAIDEHVVPRLAAILVRRVPAGDDLRVGAALALAHASGAARSPAVSALEQVLLGQLPPGHGTREDAVVLAAANALVQLRAPDARAVIVSRARRSLEPLRSRLEELLYRL
jgi:serine/threonine-protein kinase